MKGIHMANNYSQVTVSPELPVSAFSEDELERLSAVCGLSFEINCGMLYFFAQEYFCDVGEDQYMNQFDCVAFLQAKLRQLNAALFSHIVIEGAVTCSKMRTGEFGGFAYFITRDEIKYQSTRAWIREQEVTAAINTSVDPARHDASDQHSKPLVNGLLTALREILPYAESELASLKECQRRDGGLEQEIITCQTVIDHAYEILSKGHERGVKLVGG
jgi:hypothetical protein